jgi:hypothetical protein
MCLLVACVCVHVCNDCIRRWWQSHANEYCRRVNILKHLGRLAFWPKNDKREFIRDNSNPQLWIWNISGTKFRMSRTCHDQSAFGTRMWVFNDQRMA